MPLLPVIELRLCGRLGMSPARLRRQPLALVWLWFNASCQADGLETTWTRAVAAGERNRAALHARIEALRADAQPADAAI